MSRKRLTPDTADRLVELLVDCEGELIQGGASSQAIAEVTRAARQYRDGILKVATR